MTIPAGYAQINHHFAGGGMPTGGECTMGVDISGFVGDPDDLADLADLAFTGEVIGFLSDTILLVETTVKYGPDATGPSGSFSGAGQGGDTGDSGYPGASFLIQKQTASGGRPGRGRMYLPGVPENAIDPAGVIATPRPADLATAMADYALVLATGGADPVLLHGADSPVSTPTPIIGFSCSTQAATQRRRNRR